MSIDIKVAEIYLPLFTSDKKDFVLSGGRTGGKSKVAYQCCGITAANTPNSDIIITRVNASSLETSSYAEMQEVLTELGEFGKSFRFYKKPLRIESKDNSFYFFGIGGGIDRTKGIKTKHPVSLLIIEEAQELRTRDEYENTLATLRRRFGINCKVITIFNPPPSEFHWINIWAKEKQQDNDYVVIHSSWLDVANFLNDRDIKEILKTKKANIDYYNFMYLGIPSGVAGAVYPMFTDANIVSIDKNQEILRNNIAAVIIGGDGSVVRDCTTFVPVFILTNGQAIVGDPFIHDPKIDGVFGSHSLVEKFVVKYFNDLVNTHGLDNAFSRTPILMTIDSAATDLIQACKFFFSNRADIIAVKKGTQLQMVDPLQSCFTKNILFIWDNDRYYSSVKGWQRYTTDTRWNNKNPLEFQIRSLVWDKTGCHYDPVVPNDISDSLTYAIFTWFTKAENIHWFTQVQKLRKDLY